MEGGGGGPNYNFLHVFPTFKKKFPLGGGGGGGGGVFMKQ